jgi:hypothetical protein
LASAVQPEAPSLEAPAEFAGISEPPAEPNGSTTAQGSTNLRKLVDTARGMLAPVRSYQATMIRQERVGETLQPREELVLSVRRDPFAVRLEWPTGPTEGREVLYSTVETAGKMQIRQPGSIVPRLTLAPDSPLVRKNSRHPITEAGFDQLLDNLDASIRSADAGDAGNRITLDGPATIDDVGRPCHRITEIRPNGETWVVGLDTESLLPIYVHGTDAAGNLLESYAFRDVRLDVAELASAEAFDPEKRWGGGSGGVLGRLVRSGDGDGQTPAKVAR